MLTSTVLRLVLISALLCLGACGQRGPLTLPKAAAPSVFVASA